MATDVVPALNEEIGRTFTNRMTTDHRVMSVGKRIRDGTATLVDAHRYALYTGQNLSKSLQACITADTLPDGKLYYNIAKRTVTPSLRNAHGIVNQTAKQIQEIVDTKDGLGIKAIGADFPEERVQGLIDKMTSYDNFEQASVWLKEAIVNNCEAFFDDYVRANVDTRAKMGMTETIVRTAEPKCCEWCQALEGTYEYGTEPPEVYQRHEFCRCDVTFRSGRKNQNVWTKTVWESDKAQIDKRKGTNPIMDPSERKKLINNYIAKERG